MNRIVCAVCVGMLVTTTIGAALAAGPAAPNAPAGLASQPADQNSQVAADKKVSAPSGGPNDAIINTTRSNIKHPSVAEQPTIVSPTTSAGNAAKIAPTGGYYIQQPQPASIAVAPTTHDAAINTTRSNIKHPSVAVQPTTGTEAQK